MSAVQPGRVSEMEDEEIIVRDGDFPVAAGAREEEIARGGETTTEHDCFENAVPYVSDGALGHGWECGICGAFLQAG